MSKPDAWATGLMAFLAAGALLSQVYRRRRNGQTPIRRAVAQLDRGTRLIELVVGYGLMIVIGAGLMIIFIAIAPPVSGQAPDTLRLLFAGVGAVTLAIPTALLLVNLISWRILALRQANQRAFEAAGGSYASANKGLLTFSAVSWPAGVILLFIAAIRPWAS